jgi:hypothetical protein
LGEVLDMLVQRRLQLLARLTLNARKHPANQPARLAHLDEAATFEPKDGYRAK